MQHLLVRWTCLHEGVHADVPVLVTCKHREALQDHVGADSALHEPV